MRDAKVYYRVIKDANVAQRKGHLGNTVIRGVSKSTHDQGEHVLWQERPYDVSSDLERVAFLSPAVVLP